MKKREVYEGIIQKVTFPNKGLVNVEGEEKSVIVKNGIPGQKVKFCVNKIRKGKAEGRLLEVLEKSPLETRDLYAAFSLPVEVVCTRRCLTRSR